MKMEFMNFFSIKINLKPISYKYFFLTKMEKILNLGTIFNFSILQSILANIIFFRFYVQQLLYQNKTIFKIIKLLGSVGFTKILRIRVGIYSVVKAASLPKKKVLKF